MKSGHYFQNYFIACARAKMKIGQNQIRAQTADFHASHHFIARRGANDLVPRQAKQPRCGSGHAGVIFNVQNRNSSARSVT
jgi:hypothetical protein